LVDVACEEEEDDDDAVSWFAARSNVVRNMPFIVEGIFNMNVCVSEVGVGKEDRITKMRADQYDL